MLIKDPFGAVHLWRHAPGGEGGSSEVWQFVTGGGGGVNVVWRHTI